MKSKLTHISITLLVTSMLLLSIEDTFAQRIKPNRWIIEADGGVSVYFGDVKRYEYIPDHQSPSEIQPMFSASLGKEISKIFSVRGQFLYGKLSGHKQSAHYYFHSNIIGGHLLTDINLYYLFSGARYGDAKLNVYTSLGVGYLSWDSKLYSYKSSPDDSDLIGESKSGAFSIPGSISVEYVINNNFSLKAEGALFFVTSDEVDAKPGGIKFDMINYNSIGVVYKFGIKTKAKETKVKYALDASIYDPKPGDPQYKSKEEDVAVVPVVTKTEEKELIDDHVKEPEQEIAKTEEGKKIEETKEKQKEDSETYPINHELENAAIQKEVWANKSDNPWPGIEFSVQILASKTPISIDELKTKFSIPEVILEKSDGEWYRYSAGQFDKMWRAKELRNKLRSNTGIEDAFIVVYKNQERISLAEALNYAARKQNGVKEEYVKEDNAAAKVYPMVPLIENIPASGLAFGVQVLSIKNNQYPLGVFKGIHGIDNQILIHYKDPWHKLIVDGFDTYQQAHDFQFVAREKGFIDAFIVAFKDGRRISIKRLKLELGE